MNGMLPIQTRSLYLSGNSLRYYSIIHNLCHKFTYPQTLIYGNGQVYQNK